MVQSNNQKIILEYNDLVITQWIKISSERLYPVDFAHPAEYDDREIEISYEYSADRDEVIEHLWEFLTESEEFNKMDNDSLDKYVNDNFDKLLDKYNTSLLDCFREQAREAAEEEYNN